MKKSTLRRVYERDDKICQFCGRNNIVDAHHAFKKSEYTGSDRDEAWNLILLCRQCHNKVHGGNSKVDKFVKQQALKRYDGTNRRTLRQIFRERGYN